MSSHPILPRIQDHSKTLESSDNQIILKSSPYVLMRCRLGRIAVMRICGPVFLVSITLMSAAEDVAMLVLGGLAMGAASTTTNIALIIYSTEMAPPHLRARMGFTFQAGLLGGGGGGWS